MTVAFLGPMYYGEILIFCMVGIVGICLEMALGSDLSKGCVTSERHACVMEESRWIT